MAGSQITQQIASFEGQSPIAWMDVCPKTHLSNEPVKVVEGNGLSRDHISRMHTVFYICKLSRQLWRGFGPFWRTGRTRPGSHWTLQTYITVSLITFSKGTWICRAY